MTSKLPILTDICWTLYRSNTTFDFLDFTIQDASYKCLRRFFKYPIIRIINIGLLRIFHIDFQRVLALRYLRSFTTEELNQRIQDFVHNNLKTKKIEDTWAIIKNRRVVICSGTIQLIAEAIGKETNAEAIFANEIFKQKIKDKYPRYDIITDNLSDIELVRHSEHAYIVIYDNEVQWQKNLKDHPNITKIYVKDNKY